MHKYFILLSILTMSALNSYCSEPPDYDSWTTPAKEERRQLFERHKRNKNHARKREALQSSSNELHRSRDGKDPLRSSKEFTKS